MKKKTWKLTTDRALLNVILLVVICVSFFIFHIWFRTVALTTGYEVGNARKEIRILESEWAQLKVEKVKLMGPESLQKWVLDMKERGIVFEAPQSSQLIYTKSRQ